MRYSDYSMDKSSSNLLSRVYAWMTVALALTGVTAWGVAHYPPALMLIFRAPMLFWILLIVELMLVIYLSQAIVRDRISQSTATITFLLYSLLNGITLSGIFIMYTYESIAIAFFLGAGMFAAMSIYGYFTKSDLSPMGTALFMCLIGLILVMVINVFVRSTQLELIISLVGIAVFALLTAYDVQKIKELRIPGASVGKKAILGALHLYLDFLNLFLFMLSLFGNRRS